MDVKLKDMDMVTDLTGNPVYIEGMEEILQRVLICITMEKGSFAYQKDLGRAPASHISTEQGVRDLEAQLREAIVSLKGVELFLDKAVKLSDGNIKVKITVTCNNEKISAEVII